MGTNDLSKRLKAWSALLRLPNLPTVPGDPLVGLAFVSAVTGRSVGILQAGAVAAASLCLYMAGLILNDLHDLPRDRARRPERPLASKAISVSSASRFLAVLCAIGLLCALCAGRGALAAACALLVLVYAYNVLLKESALDACICMGLCRGVSLLLGAAAAGAPTKALLPAAALATYIGTVTWLARGEDKVQVIRWFAFVPAMVLALGWLTVWLPRLGSAPTAALVFSLIPALGAVGGGLLLGLRLYGSETPPRKMQATIGGFIMLLLPWQSAMLVTAGTPGTAVCSLLILLLWPLSFLLSRVFRAS